MTAINSSGPASQSSSGQMANVRFGVYTQPAPVAGKTVSDIREQFSKLWGIPSDAVAYKGKDKLDENYVVTANDNLEFHRRAGEKG
jgi:hypothetical protein